jgi:hypothetical protein
MNHHRSSISEFSPRSLFFYPQAKQTVGESFPAFLPWLSLTRVGLKNSSSTPGRQVIDIMSVEERIVAKEKRDLAYRQLQFLPRHQGRLQAPRFGSWNPMVSCDAGGRSPRTACSFWRQCGTVTPVRYINVLKGAGARPSLQQKLLSNCYLVELIALMHELYVLTG